MLALLRANPDAFINGNINRLKQGAVLRVPPSEEQARLGEAEAAALVRQQMTDWRQARRPIPQPVDSTPRPRRRVSLLHGRRPRLREWPRPGLRSYRPLPVPRPVREHNPASMPEARVTCFEPTTDADQGRARGARSRSAGTARAVAELESIKQQQGKLIAMKDSELAAAQQRLARSQGDASQPLWMWAGLGLLVAGSGGRAGRSARRKPWSSPGAPASTVRRWPPHAGGRWRAPTKLRKPRTSRTGRAAQWTEVRAPLAKP